MLEVSLTFWLAFIDEMTLDTFIFCKEKMFDDAGVGTARGCQVARRRQSLDFGELCHLNIKNEGCFFVGLQEILTDLLHCVH